MHRTQIYLDEAQANALDRVARTTKQTRSQLIRAAIDATYVRGEDPATYSTTLRRTAGAWRGRRPDGEQYVDGIRSRPLERGASR